LRAAPYLPVVIEGPWREGPGLVRDPQGHAPRAVEAPCDRVPIDLIRATRVRSAPTDLAHFGADITGTDACSDPGRALATLDGFAMPSPQRTIDLVLDRKIVRIERRAVAEKLALRVLDTRVDALDAVPVTARLGAGTLAVRVDGQVGLVLDDSRLWAIADPAVASLNASSPTWISAARWNTYERGPDLVRR